MKKLIFLLIFLPAFAFTQQNAKNENNIVIPKGKVTLKGFTRFAFTALKESRIIADGFTLNFLECTAELTFSDKNNFVLTTKEFFPGSTTIYREANFKGEITPNGQLTFTWPAKWYELGMENIWKERTDALAQVRRHTGMKIFGQGISKNTLNYMGYFDGNKLFADMPLVGLAEVPGEMDFFKKLVDGPVMINFMFDLEIAH
jgi:hypothetical protein